MHLIICMENNAYKIMCMKELLCLEVVSMVVGLQK